MLDHVFTDAISALREAFEGAFLERQAFEEHFQVDVLLGDIVWETSYGLPGEGSPPRVEAHITFEWPTWSQTAYRRWYLEELFEDPPVIDMEIILRVQRLATTPDLRGVLGVLPATSPPIGRDGLERGGPTVESAYSTDPLEPPALAIEVSYEGSYELGSTEGNLRIRTSEESDGRGPFPKLSKPLIGAINGVAVTGGFELALNCDLLVASERARFGDTHTRVGVMPGWGLTVLLSQAIGVRRAREMSFTGNFLSGQEAFEWGLVNHVVAHEELMPFTRALALDIVSNDQAGVRQIRATYAAVTATTIADGWLVEAHDAGAWSKRGIDPAEIERRRAAIVERGHRQA